MQTQFTIAGMHCAHCEGRIQREVGAIEGVSGVSSDYRTGIVTVTSAMTVPTAAFAAAVDEAGYDLVDA